MATFEKISPVDCSAEALFDWHALPGAFERLVPPWEKIQLVSFEGLHEGARGVLRVPVGPLRFNWVAIHGDIEVGRRFTDEQISGPFRSWKHTHTFRPANAKLGLTNTPTENAGFGTLPTAIESATTSNSCELIDRIDYEPMLGVLGSLFAGGLIRRQLIRTFDYRHRITQNDLAFHLKQSSKVQSMKIAVGGSTGLVGSALIPFLTTGGHDVVRLVRGAARDSQTEIAWNPVSGELDSLALKGVDAVVHLGGHNIASGRWTAARKKLMLDSRVNSANLIAKTLASMDKPPRTFVCASAIGYYGDRDQDVMSETSEPGPDYISDLCKAWEDSVEPARQAGIRVVNLRIGVVLSPKGGALHKMLTPFKLCGGGVVGSGKQWWSWIGLDDLIRVILHCVTTDSISGPVNATAPGIVQNREFTKTLGRVLKRPTLVPMPTFVVKAVFGEMGKELLLASTRVDSQKLLGSDYEFAFPELEPALRHLLGR